MFSIPLSVPCLQGNEWQYVKECLDEGWVSSAGEFVELFENKITEYTGSKYAIACINGTSALHVSLRLSGVQPGDEVIVPTLTFIAPINAVSYNGASPVFMDADKYYNIDADKIIQFLKKETDFTKKGSWVTVNRKTGKRIAAIILVHVWGNAVWQDDLVEICEEKNIAIVEDACESLGTVYSSGKYRGRHTCNVGKVSCLSFNGNKIITTGGGGMILTKDEKLAEKARYLTTQAKDNPMSYIHHEIGYNFRLSNIQAAMGVAQLQQLPEFLKRKKENYLQYRTGINDINGLTIAAVPDYAENNHWLNLLQIDSEIYGKDRIAIMKRMGSNGIQTRPVWALNHTQKQYFNCMSYKIERAEKLVNNSLCLPSSTNLRYEDINKVISYLNE